MDEQRSRLLTDAQSTEFLSRAAQLDANRAFSLTQLRDAALEAGIDRDAIEQASSELSVNARQQEPDWVRFSLLGVPNLSAAQFWYQLLCVAGLATASLALLAPSVVPPRLGQLASLWFFGCATVTAKAIRWTSRSKSI